MQSCGEWFYVSGFIKTEKNQVDKVIRKIDSVYCLVPHKYMYLAKLT